MPALLSQTNQVMASAALVLSVVALLLIAAIQTTPCANAQSGSCAVGDTEIFASGVTVNEDGNDADTRMEGDNDPNLWFLDAGNDRIGIGTDTPAQLLDVDGTFLATDVLVTNDLAVAEGGTGTSTITSNEVMIGLGSAAVTTVNTGTVGFVLTSTGASAPTWQASPGGVGITEADQWRVTSSFTGSATPITANWERVDTDGFSVLGTGMSESSGIFTFPSTGYWLITFKVDWNASGIAAGVDTSINTTLNDTDYDKATRGRGSGDSSGQSASPIASFLFDVTNTSTHKVRFAIDENANGAIGGDTDLNRTHVTFIRLGAT